MGYLKVLAIVSVRYLDQTILSLLRSWGVDKSMKRWYNYPRFKAEDRCRFCSHAAVLHLTIKNFGMDNQQGSWDRCVQPALNCSCPGFAPIDNLDYLETKIDG